MDVSLDKSFDDNLKSVGLNESQVIKAVIKLDASKKGGRRYKGAGPEDDKPAEPEVTLSASERLAIAKAAIISAVAQLARPAAAGALLLTTHKAFAAHLCSQNAATIAKSLAFLPIVGAYSEQCETTQRVYAGAVTTAVALATTILLPQIKEGLQKIHVSEDLVKTITEAIGGKAKGKGRKTKRTLRKRKSKKTDSKKSLRRH
jgi:hypothetical protein